ncbi:amidohydrolase [Microterricola pindariensis]|uniref:Amidohydrolase n=1 Tax=Microterricola pindariensis TaxID=478010 RepID=A0ABX5AQK4_9MICO|nr:amidohydrolase [Microterricola pindariensis]PPL14267.1 amidohydrolase [Microterricola pindariensis]
MSVADDFSARFADRVFFGTVLTMDEEMPDAEAVAVQAGRIVAVGSRADVEELVGPDTVVTELGEAVLLPGFVEAHGHPLTEAIFLGPKVVDIRPVVAATAAEVLHRLTDAIAQGDPAGVYANGWDALLQTGLPEPTLAWLNQLSPDRPLAILHNSGHSAYFNTAAARATGVSRDTPDPVGASFGRDADGNLDGTLRETAAAAMIFGPALQPTPAEYVDALTAESGRLNRAGITSVGELGYDPNIAPALAAAREAGALTVRLRLYEMSSPARSSASRPGDGDAAVRHTGIKLWADGSPWVGNIATSFPYLDTPATRSLGLEPGHRGHANYTPEQIAEISEAYFTAGWQLACHVHGDAAVDMVLDQWEALLMRHPREDHRLRLEHVGSMTAAQFERAAALGITAGIFIDHLYYWGDVLVDDLFGPEHGAVWAAAGSAAESGIRFSFHNDGQVTPAEPLRNIEIAATRRSRSGTVLAPEQRISVARALRAETIDSAYQLFSDHEFGSITPGKLADLVVLARSPLSADLSAGSIADIPVLETVLGGVTVHQAS